MSPFVRAVALALASGTTAAAATPEQIDAALNKGVAVLKGRFANGAGPILGAGAGGDYGVGPAALAGIALLEARVPATDPAVKAVAAAVRDEAYRAGKTYQIALCLVFLDRLEDPADVALIQTLGARLVAGQNARGGWTYECVTVAAADEQRLRAGLKGAELVTGKDVPRGGVPKLHPLVQEYFAALWAARPNRPLDDNSNTQFGVLAVWAARKHGAPVDGALDLIERRFLASQLPHGGWAYSGDGAGFSTPSMTCAGLLGLATAIGRREERRLKAEAPAKTPDTPAKAGDPFFNPPPRPDGKGPAGPKRPADARDLAVGRAFGHLGTILQGAARGGGGAPGGEGDVNNLYFLWSLERVGVIFGVDKIGGMDWYAAGADFLVRTQLGDGNWKGSYDQGVDTCFAVLFLCKSNVARDLSSKVKGDAGGSELRAGVAAAPTEVAGPLPKGPVVPANPLPAPVANPLPAGAAGKVTADLLRAAAGPGWARALDDARDAKGADYTAGLVAAIPRLDADKRKAARDALADRLTRMSADTLRGMMSNADAELRRGAVLAAAMRDDKAHVPDLIDRLADADDGVVRAARAGLRSLTEQDFGPAPGATADDRTRAVAAWRAWWARQKR